MYERRLSYVIRLLILVTRRLKFLQKTKSLLHGAYLHSRASQCFSSVVIWHIQASVVTLAHRFGPD